MRTQVTRFTLRNASRLLTPSTPKSSFRPVRRPIAVRPLCTSTASISSNSTSGSNSTGAGNNPGSNPGTASSTAATHSTTIPTDGLPSQTPAITTMTDVDPEVETEPILEPGSRLPSVSDPKILASQLSQLLKRNAVRTAMWHFSSALSAEDSPAIDTRVAKIILPVLGRNGWGATASDALNLFLEREYDLGIGTYNCGLHAISRSGDHKGINDIIEKMWALPKDSQPNATSYNYLIGAHVYRGTLDGAFDVMTQMKDKMVYPTFSTYHALITGCLRRREPRRAYATLLAVQKQRFDVSAMTIAQVLVSSANNDDFDHVVELLDTFESALPRYSFEVSRIAESRHLYRMNSDVRTTSEERMMLRGEPRLELGALSAVLHCAFRGGRSDIATRTWALIEEFYPDEPIPAPMWYCLIGAYAGAGELSKAFDTLATMRERGIQPSLKDLEVSLVRPLAFDVAKIDEQFFRLVDRHEGKEVSATDDSAFATEADASAITSTAGEETNASTSSSTIEATNESEQLSTDGEKTDSALGDDIDNTTDIPANSDISAMSNMSTADISQDSSIDKISKSLGEVLLEAPEPTNARRGIEPFKPTTVGIEELNCIIAACSVANDLDRAFQTYDEIESRFGLTRNSDTFDALLEGCVQTRHLRGGLRVLQEMDSLGLPRSTDTIHLACRMFLRAGKLENAIDEIKRARQQGNPISMQTYHMIIKQCLRNENEQEAGDIAQSLMDDGYSRRLITGRMDFATIQQLDRVLEKTNVQGYEDNINEVSDREPGMKEDLTETDVDEMIDDSSVAAEDLPQETISDTQTSK